MGRQDRGKASRDRPSASSSRVDNEPRRPREKTLLLSTRGTSTQHRHLLQDLASILPHAKKESKLDGKDKIYVANEVAEMNNCNNCILFEVRRGHDLYLWLAKTPNGPSAKFHVLNVHTMAEVRLTGNCLKGSRFVLSFDKTFNELPHAKLLKEMFTQAFAVPEKHKHSKPFIDHVVTLSVCDGKIWFRHYQVVEWNSEKEEPVLVEIGPRFVMNLVRIFAGSLSGMTLYENPDFVSPAAIMRMQRKRKATRVADRSGAKTRRKLYEAHHPMPKDPLADVFDYDSDSDE